MVSAVHCDRSFSDTAVQRAIDRFSRRFAGTLRDEGVAMPTVAPAGCVAFGFLAWT